MERSEVENAVLTACGDTEWHLSLWFPRVAREVLGLPKTVADAEAQRCLLAMVEAGALEAGAVDGAEFDVRPLEMGAGVCPDLYIRAAATIGAGQSR